MAEIHHCEYVHEEKKYKTKRHQQITPKTKQRGPFPAPNQTSGIVALYGGDSLRPPAPLLYGHPKGIGLFVIYHSFVCIGNPNIRQSEFQRVLSVYSASSAREPVSQGMLFSRPQDRAKPVPPRRQPIPRREQPI